MLGSRSVRVVVARAPSSAPVSVAAITSAAIVAHTRSLATRRDIPERRLSQPTGRESAMATKPATSNQMTARPAPMTATQRPTPAAAAPAERATRRQPVGNTMPPICQVWSAGTRHHSGGPGRYSDVSTDMITDTTASATTDPPTPASATPMATATVYGAAVIGRCVSIQRRRRTWAIASAAIDVATTM